MKKRNTLLLGLSFTFLLATSSWADGIASWSAEQHVQPKTHGECGKGCIHRFNHTVNKADVDYVSQGWEAADYWGQEAQKARHHTVSYLVDLGDLYHRMGQATHGRSYYHFAHKLRRKTVEDNLELGMAFLSSNRPGLANYYFKKSMDFARSKRDFQAISDAFTKLGNARMAKRASWFAAKHR